MPLVCNETAERERSQKPFRNRKVRGSSPCNIHTSCARKHECDLLSLEKTHSCLIVLRNDNVGEMPTMQMQSESLWFGRAAGTKKNENHGSESILCRVVMLTKTIEKEYWIPHSYLAIHFHPSASAECVDLMLEGLSVRDCSADCVCYRHYEHP